CNGCQLMMELGLIAQGHASADGYRYGRMEHNTSHKFESAFLGVNVPKNNSVMFGSLAGTSMGIWVAHGEGRFSLPLAEENYNVVAKYNYSGYPANPNGSVYNIAGIASADGRHVAMMPHLERCIFPWQCGTYPADRLHTDEVTPWIEAFVNARHWCQKKA
ncbi:MAG: phosphoribosylformylglycinamidine synthase subunit PurQ, partial [Bacteroidaceae bacterium]|nr:phosphoribosylformylglycinamidine synthase subunit PurQ [Bacteroidaceae bacterium]